MSGSIVYQIDIQTAIAGTYITNVWHVYAPSLLDAVNMGLDDIAPLMAKLIPPTAFVNLVRASNPAPRDGNFISAPCNIPGTKVSESGGLLPLWNRYMLNLLPPFGYSGRKFAVGLMESETQDGILIPSAIAGIQGNVCDPLAALGYLCSPGGQYYTACNISPLVHMRQLRRRKKRATPVISA